MRWITCATIVTAAALVLAGGCLHSRVEENWGDAYDAQLGWQTRNPEAAAAMQPPEGLDPETGMRVAERYYKTEENQRQRQAPTVVIGEMK